MRNYGPKPTGNYTAGSPLIKQLIITLACAAIGVELFSALFGGPLHPLLAFSLKGLQHFFLWQPFTSLFLLHPYPTGLSFFFLIELGFYSIILWGIGTQVLEYAGKRAFLTLLACSGIFANLVTLPLLGAKAVAGPEPCIYTLLTVWAMLNPEAELLLFFAIPVKARHLLLFLFGANFLIDLSHWNFLGLMRYSTAVLAGYFFGAGYYRLNSPFSQTYSIDAMVHHLGQSLEARWERLWAPKTEPGSKIYDIHSGEQVVDEERFMDAMLSKISTQGEESLTTKERRRMRKISEKLNAEKGNR